MKVDEGCIVDLGGFGCHSMCCTRIQEECNLNRQAAECKALSG